MAYLLIDDPSEYPLLVISFIAIFALNFYVITEMLKKGIEPRKENWASLWFKRKALEEKKKIADLEKRT